MRTGENKLDGGLREARQNAGPLSWVLGGYSVRDVFRVSNWVEKKSQDRWPGRFTEKRSGGWQDGYRR